MGIYVKRRYTKNMKFFVDPVKAPTAQSVHSWHASVLLAGVVTLMLVAQLFTFDEFIPLADSFSLPGFSGVGFATAVVLLELLSLPFLLRMALSPAFRWLSMGSLGVVVVLWLYSTVTVVLFRQVESVGFTGGFGSLTPGWWAVFLCGALAVLAAWSIWGLWPGVRNSRKSKVKKTRTAEP